MKRSKFNLSHTQLLTCKMGKLVPIGITEVLPGDSFQHACSAFIRAAPLATPPMHPVRIAIRHFYVPNRLIWENWEDFITGGPDGMDASIFPTMAFDGGETPAGSLADYLGIAPDIPSSPPTLVSALPFRAYVLIFNEWYRDQDLVPKLPLSIEEGEDVTTSRILQNAAWEKDYFTTCRPWEQKGPTVTLPLGTSAPVVIDQFRNVTLNETRSLETVEGENGGGGAQGIAAGSYPRAGWDQNQVAQLLGTADLSTASAANVNELRLAFALQRYEEARARYGSRYTEYLRYLGIRPSDARLQRPEYLGGGVTSLQFSEVLSTTATAPGANETTGVGALAGHGIGLNRTNRYRRFFEEHGFVVTLMHVVPQTMYPQGLFRHWNRRTKEDFWQMELQHIGQQAVFNKEVYLGHANPDGVFGFQDRYDEYRRAESQVHGEFRNVLSDWHFARNFNTNIALNADFVTANPSVNPFQAQENDTLYCAVRHQLVARRMLAKKGSSFIL